MTSLIAGSVACIILLALVAYLLIRAFRISHVRDFEPEPAEACTDPDDYAMTKTPNWRT